MNLFPRLPLFVALPLASSYGAQDLRELEKLASVSHEAAVFGPVGGTRVTERGLRKIQELLSELGQKHGYPRKATREQARAFDSLVGELLHRQMVVTPHEAAQNGVWQFVSCVLAPELVRWRFPGQNGITAPQRYLGGVRNTFGRLWWRAHILFDDRNENPYHFLNKLGEDEIVQILERPTMAGNAELVRATVDSFLASIESVRMASGSRMIIMRETQKRLMRVFPLVAVDLMEPARIEAFVRAQALEALTTVRKQSGFVAESQSEQAYFN